MEVSVAAGRRRWGWRGLVVAEGAGCSPGGMLEARRGFPQEAVLGCLEGGRRRRQRREIEADWGRWGALSYQQREVWLGPMCQLIPCWGYQHLPANWL